MNRAGVATAVPVLCVGNFTAGGAGKTPTALELARRLSGHGHRPAFLSRGHGRRRGDNSVIAVDARRHRAEEVGDEPLLLARLAPTFVAADRRAAAEAAVVDGATVLVMDDGLQNPTLVKTASMVVVDGATGIGNGLCIPAGPLRAPLRAQWATVSLLCVIGRGRPGERLALDAQARDVPVVNARLEPDAASCDDLKGRRLFAFSGIGRPEKFLETLDRCGADVVGRRAFPDHHVFTERERLALYKDARLSGAELVTTEKDRVRLPADFETHVLPVRLVIEGNEAAIDRMLEGFSRR